MAGWSLYGEVQFEQVWTCPVGWDLVCGCGILYRPGTGAMCRGRAGAGALYRWGGCKEIPLWTEWLTGRHEWKHYLPATSLVGGKNFKQFNILPFRFSLRFTCHFASLNCTWPQLTEKIVANEAWLFTFCHSMMSMLLRTTSTLTPVNQGCIQMN